MGTAVIYSIYTIIYKDFMEQKAKRRIKNLIDQINNHNHAYYVLDDPELTDMEYDKLFRELEDIEYKYPQLISPSSPTQRVGHPVDSGLKSYNHVVPMLSLSNAINNIEIKEFYKRVLKWLNNTDTEFVAEPKIDGLGVSLIYKNGILERALTRGDGFKGEDITHNVRTMLSVPLQLIESDNPPPPFIEIRGEIFMTISDFERLNKNRKKLNEKLFANARNAAAGSVRQLDPSITASRNLSIYCYEVGGSEKINFKNQMGMLSYLKSVGIPINPLSKKISNADDMIAFHDTLENNRSHINYEIDGSVIKVNDYSLRNRLGLRARSPRWAIAAKFKAKQTESQILNIELQVGRTGVITPVAKIKEVDLSGVMISSATLHNQDEIDRKDIRINDFILIERSGDVIPKISKVLKDKRPRNTQKFSIGDFNCPESGCKIERIEDQAAYRCLNIECKSRILGMLEHFCAKNAMNIEGMGPQIVRQLVEANLINSFDDIFKLQYNDLVALERFKDKSAMNLINAINQSKKTNLPRFVFGLGIPNVGQHISKVIDKHCNSSLTKLKELKMNEMEEIDGIGSTVANAIVKYFDIDKNNEIINNCLNLGVKIEPTHFDKTNMKLLSKKIVITGSFESLSRSDLKQRLEKSGATVTSTISSKTTVLIVGNNPGSKLTKAQNLDIKIVYEEELHNFLDEN